MSESSTAIAGIVIPSTSPVFLGVVVFHVVVALVCVITGFVAMMSQKGPGRHHDFGRVYYWFLLAVFVSASALSFMRWEHNQILFALGLLAFTLATIGRAARRRLWRLWMPIHIGGMGTSYIVLLIAFYVDNGQNLPLWRDLPTFSYWLIPLAIGLPIVIWATIRHTTLNQTTI
jgi:uncharacterized membrane protein